MSPSRKRPPPPRDTGVLTRTVTATRTRTSTRTRTATRAATATGDVFVVALIDNNARDVGFCAYNLKGFGVELRQFADANTYGAILTALCVFAPVEILMCISSKGGALDRAISGCPYLDYAKWFLETAQRSFIGRSYFNETYGAIAAEKLSSVRCPNLTNLGESTCYLALAACGALIRYVEHIDERSFPPGSLVVRFRPNDHAVFLDWSTLEGLEVVQNARASAGVGGVNDTACLLRVIDKTKTRAGKRFLRRALLEPCTELVTISMRQDAVDEFGNSEEIYFASVSVLAKFPDLEKTIASLMSSENVRLRSMAQVKGQSRSKSKSAEDSDDSAAEDDSVKEAKPVRRRLCLSEPPSMRLIRDMLNIKAALETVAPLLESIQSCQSALLKAIAESMRSAEFTLVQREIADVIDPEALPAKQAEKMRMQGAFAVQFGRNGSLDVSRKALSENVEDMNALTEELKTKYQLPKLQLAMNVRRGYHLTIPTKVLQVQDFPDEFIQVDEGQKLHRFSTTALVQLNARYQYSLQEIWKLQEIELASLLNTIFKVNVLTALHRLCDSIAILDMIISFVTYSSLCNVQTERPRLTASGPIALQLANHPILLHIRPNQVVPNDVFLDETSALHVITGRNQSGKSTFIRMVGLITIMAHAGCMVPAKFASVRLLRKVASRFARGDDITRQQSHFSQEMSDVAAIIRGIREREENLQDLKKRDGGKKTDAKGIPSNTLVLIDELGRSTSTVDGFSIAYAVARYLSSCPNVLTLFTTHFLGLGAISTVSPIISTFHLETIPVPSEGQSAEASQLSSAPRKFTYNVLSGTLQETSYGISTAAHAGFVESIWKDAQMLSKEMPVRTINSVEDFASSHYGLNAASKRLIRKTASVVTLAQRISLIKHSTKDPTEIHRLLSELQKKVKESQRKRRGVVSPGSSTRVASAKDNETKADEIP